MATPVEQITLAAQKAADAANVLEQVVEGDENVTVTTVGGRTLPSIEKWFADNFSLTQTFITQEADRSTQKASEAAQSETNAGISETNASNSETAAGNSQVAALASEQKAAKWAEELQNVEVEGGKYSAKHYALAVEASKNAAALSETNAATSEANAAAYAAQLDKQISYISEHDATGNVKPLTPSSGSAMYKISGAGTFDGETYVVGDYTIYDSIATVWLRIAGSGKYIRSDIAQNITQNMEFQDNVELQFGSGSDMRLFHNGSDSYVLNYSGHLRLENRGLSQDVRLIGRSAADAPHNILWGDPDGAAILYNNNAEKFRTNSTGVTVTGTLYADGIDIGGQGINEKFARVGANSTVDADSYVRVGRDSTLPALYVDNIGTGRIAEFTSGVSKTIQAYIGNDGTIQSNSKFQINSNSFISEIVHNASSVGFNTSGAQTFVFDNDINTTGELYAKNGKAVLRDGADFTLNKSQALFKVRGLATGDQYVDQTAGIYVGEDDVSAFKIIALGNGVTYLGAGTNTLGAANNPFENGSGFIPEHWVMKTNASNDDIDFHGELRAQGDVVAFYSDERLKEVDTEIKGALDIIDQWRAVYYTANHDGVNLANGIQGKREVGLLAQDIQKTVPEAIELAPFDNDGEGNSKSGEEYMTVKYHRLTAVLAAGVKDLHEGYKDLKRMYNSLATRLDALEGKK